METTTPIITPHSGLLSATNYLHKPTKPIPEGYVTLEVFMTNLLKEVRSRYATKDNNH